MSYHTVEITLTTVAIFSLVLWWECVCRLNCPDKFWHFYLGAPLLFFGWTRPGAVGCALQVIGVAIMLDSAYMARRRCSGDDKDYSTPLWRGMLWGWHWFPHHHGHPLRRE